MIYRICVHSPSCEPVAVRVQPMHAKTIIEGVALAVVIVTAIAMLPDFVRYIKIRSM